ncbi:uncharacterized protein [Emydura macquarii macquarii]|uniref:uncharacterized protein n=1 Tax=Emydura macquarii macquarii TaxID=1129001 RepID=UPI00352B1A1E
MGRRRRRAAAGGRALGLAGLAGLGLLLLLLLLAAWAWARSPPRDLPEEIPGPLELLAPPLGHRSRAWFLQHLGGEEAPRERRSAPKGRKGRQRKTAATPASAAHYEVRAAEGRAGIYSESDGTIRGWAETQLNSSSPVSYDPAKGEFAVLRGGLYYLYCQVHFSEDRTVYMKLDVVVDGVLALRCLEQFPPTSADPQGPELRVCQVSGLLLLQPRSALSLRTIPGVRLKAERFLTYFGLFQHPAGRRMQLAELGTGRFPAARPAFPLRKNRTPAPAASRVPRGSPAAPATCKGPAPGSLLHPSASPGQRAHMGALQEELAGLRGQLAAARRGETGASGETQGPGKWGVPQAADSSESPVWRRGKRGFEGSWRQQDQRHQHRKRSVLHLAPSHRFTSDEGDVTQIWWQPSLHQGRALEVHGPNITVKQMGLYLIYTQVLFHDPTFTMGQVLWRVSPRGPGQILLRCVQSMPREPEQAYNSCYSAGVFQLQRGDQLSLRVPRANASLDLSAHGTFLGLLRL